jgi:hypothetical protein
VSSQISSDARLLHSSYTHGIFTVVLAINDKHTLPIKNFPSNFTYPVREVRGDYGVLEISWHTITIHRANQRWDVIEKNGWNQLRVG